MLCTTPVERPWSGSVTCRLIRLTSQRPCVTVDPKSMLAQKRMQQIYLGENMPSTVSNFAFDFFNCLSLIFLSCRLQSSANKTIAPNHATNTPAIASRERQKMKSCERVNIIYTGHFLRPTVPACTSRNSAPVIPLGICISVIAKIRDWARTNNRDTPTHFPFRNGFIAVRPWQRWTNPMEWNMRAISSAATA